MTEKSYWLPKFSTLRVLTVCSFPFRFVFLDFMFFLQTVEKRIVEDRVCMCVLCFCLSVSLGNTKARMLKYPCLNIRPFADY